MEMSTTVINTLFVFGMLTVMLQVDDVSLAVNVTNIAVTSLREPYALNPRELLELRTANIHKWRQYHQYKQTYNEQGIDRRNNLSLEEFWDIYDGKW